MSRYIDADKGLRSKIQLETGCNFATADRIVESRPTADVIPIPKDATNGDMVLATGMFSVVKELNDGIMVYVKPKGVFGQVLEYNKDWWDAPFKESEG
ncbi:MAG: hypothetical protein K6A05_05895 [Lachnospiraceae bacterium]|nr:hypothetical protein [Lachnospiraceae bacterium]